MQMLIGRAINFGWVCVVTASLLTGCGGGASSSDNGSSSGGAQPPPASSSSGSTPSNGPSTNPDSSSISSSSSSGATDEPVSPFFYFSYDDSNSTASRDLTHFYIENAILPPNKSWGRAYEYLNAETFDHFSPETVGPFEISMGLYTPETEAASPVDRVPDGLSLAYFGVNISGPELTKEQRPNIVLTLLLDVSGSMNIRYAPLTREGMPYLIDVAKHGLSSLTESLKEGDIVNLVTFATITKVVVDKVSFSSSFAEDFAASVDLLVANGSTNLNAGVEKAYEVALESYDAGKSNRVVMITDARANEGRIDPSIIANNLTINGAEGIHFSGIGVGSGFNEAFLNELTDIGKGGYSAMITPSDAKRLFTKGFVRFIDDAAKNVRFKITYPETLTHLVKSSSAEQVSQDKDDVQTTNFAYNSEQFFLEKFTVTEITAEDMFELEIEYDDDSGQRQTLVLSKTIDELLIQGEDQIKSATLVALLANLVSGRVKCWQIEDNNLLSQASLGAVFAQYQYLITQFCQAR